MTTELEPNQTYRQFAIEEYTPDHEPYYQPVGDEVDLFRAAFEQKIPVLLKGPTGCGKTRFVEYMAYQLGRPLTVVKEQGTSPDSASIGANGKDQALSVVTVA